MIEIHKYRFHLHWVGSAAEVVLRQFDVGGEVLEPLRDEPLEAAGQLQLVDLLLPGEVPQHCRPTPVLRGDRVNDANLTYFHVAQQNFTQEFLLFGSKAFIILVIKLQFLG